MNKKLIISTLFLTTFNCFAHDLKGVKELPFETYKCENNIFAERCYEYMRNLDLYKEKKASFKDNKVKYFFQPTQLVNGITVPQIYNKLVDDVFKSLKRSSISETNLKIAIRFKDSLKNEFQKNVSPELKIDSNRKYNREEIIFAENYNKSYDDFYKRIKIFEKITSDYSNLDKFDKVYPEIDEVIYYYTENDFSESDLAKKLQKIGEKNSIACSYGQYELIRWEILQEIKCN